MASGKPANGWALGLGVASLLLLAGCGGGSNEEPQNDGPGPSTMAGAEPVGSPNEPENDPLAGEPHVNGPEPAPAGVAGGDPTSPGGAAASPSVAEVEPSALSNVGEPTAPVPDGTEAAPAPAPTPAGEPQGDPSPGVDPVPPAELDPRLPEDDAQAVRDRVDALLPGPRAVDCGAVNDCVVGQCAEDTMPCFGSYSIQAATDLAELNGCTSVEGDLSVAAPDLADLQGLASLVAVGGTLRIFGGEELVNLRGLENLQSVGGDLLIQGTAGYDLYNKALTTLRGLEGLRFVGNTVRIDSNPVLATLDGLELQYAGGVSLTSNLQLTSIEALSTLRCTQSVTVERSNALSSLSGLEGLENVFSVKLSSNLALANIDALSALTFIPGSLYISGNAVLSGLGGLRQLEAVGDLGIRSNDSLTSLMDLQNLKVVAGDLELSTPTGDYSGLSSVQIVGGQFSVRADLDGPVTLRGLDSLEAVRTLSLQGPVTFAGADKLTTVALLALRIVPYTSLEAFEAVTVTDGVWIRDNPELTSLDGLHHDGGWSAMTIEDNPALASVAALTGLSAVTNGVQVINNPVLTTLQGLDDLQIAGILDVTGNGLLESSAELDALDTVWRQLVVTNLPPTLFPNLQSVAELTLRDDTTLSDLSPFAGAMVTTALQVDGTMLQSLEGMRHGSSLGSVSLDRNPALVDLQALRGLTSLTGELSIEGNDALPSLAGLDDLQMVGEGLFINFDPMLENVDGLAALTTVGVAFEIRENDRLENLDGLSQLTMVVDEPEGSYPISYITNNPSLPQCAAEALLAQLGDFAHGYAFGNLGDSCP